MKNCVGEIREMSNGMKAELICYRGYSDIDIRFEDGYVAMHKDYKCFQRGTIFNPNYKSSNHKAQDILGNTAIALNGQKMTIIEVRNRGDIDVMFEDGTIVKNVSNKSFKVGQVKNPNFDFNAGKINVWKPMRCGLDAKITRFGSTNDVDIEFEDGSKVCGINSKTFRNGNLGHPLLNKGNNSSENFHNYKLKKRIIINDMFYFKTYKDKEFIGVLTLKEILGMEKENYGH